MPSHPCCRQRVPLGAGPGQEQAEAATAPFLLTVRRAPAQRTRPRLSLVPAGTVTVAHVPAAQPSSRSAHTRASSSRGSAVRRAVCVQTLPVAGTGPHRSDSLPRVSTGSRTLDSARFYHPGLLSAIQLLYVIWRAVNIHLPISWLAPTFLRVGQLHKERHRARIHPLANKPFCCCTYRYLPAFPAFMRAHTDLSQRTWLCKHSYTHAQREPRFSTAGISVTAAAALAGTATGKQKRKSLFGTRICGP